MVNDRLALKRSSPSRALLRRLDGDSWLPDRLVDFRIVAPGLPPEAHPGPDTRRATLPDTCGLGARKLAELMNAWRALALAKDTRARPWG